ncbi:hypothetical protein SAMN05519103_09056 [Rhizobiales bacterium GAS113]|nr:hypothetical protein SAMN05519103_09056 [Rhizobiales bacterium GAS113]
MAKAVSRSDGGCGSRRRRSREAGRSHNPLYTTHRDILDEIAAAAAAPGLGKDLAARVAELEAIVAELRNDARQHAQEKRALASENLNLLYRARAAEDRLAAREAADARRKQNAPSPAWSGGRSNGLASQRPVGYPVP